MKRLTNKLLLITFVSSIVAIIFFVLAVQFNDFTLFSITNSFFEESTEIGLILFPISILADFAAIFMYFLLILIVPGLWLLVSIIMQIIARLFQIGEMRKWKDVTSKVFSYISLSLQILLFLYLILIFISTFNILLLFSIISVVVGIVIYIKEMVKNKKSI